MNDLLNAVAHIVPLMQIMHDSGFYQFMPTYMRTFGPNLDDVPSFKDIRDQFKGR